MPGKFEGEPSYAEYFFDLSMEGGQDDSFVSDYDVQIDYFKASPADISNAGKDGDILMDFPHVILWESNDGFVYTDVFESWEDAKNFMRHELEVSDLD